MTEKSSTEENKGDADRLTRRLPLGRTGRAKRIFQSEARSERIPPPLSNGPRPLFFPDTQNDAFAQKGIRQVLDLFANSGFTGYLDSELVMVAAQLALVQGLIDSGVLADGCDTKVNLETIEDALSKADYAVRLVRM